MKTDSHRNRGGYSLVEISLALMVAALGVMATFALFPQSLDSARKATEATEISAFAEFVFASIANDVSTGGWDTVTAPLSLNVSHALAGVDNQDSQIKVFVGSSSTIRSNYWWRPGTLGYGIAMEPFDAAYFNYTLTVGTVASETSRYVRLEVWPGKTNSQPSGAVFYRKFCPLR